MSEIFYNRYKKIINTRNYLVHCIAEMPKTETRLRMLSEGEMFGRKHANSNGEFLLFDKEYSKLARSYIMGMRAAGNDVANLLQIIVNTWEE